MAQDLTAADLLTPAQAGRELGLTADRVRQLADSGALACTRTALGRLFRRQDVERLRTQRLTESYGGRER